MVKGELARNPTDGATIPKRNVRAEITCEDDEKDSGPVQYMEREQAERF